MPGHGVLQGRDPNTLWVIFFGVPFFLATDATILIHPGGWLDFSRLFHVVAGLLVVVLGLFLPFIGSLSDRIEARLPSW